ncbi:MAG: hypothetical protein HY849_01410 [Nitrosomonadales bacterium]|nr:hypothetical protein [Nitrosomonadales bacterium]
MDFGHTRPAGIARATDTRRETRHALPAASTLALAVWLALPNSALALSIGDLELRSALGHPLVARVALNLAPGESVDDSCFSLTVPDAQNADEYLTQAQLALQNDGSSPRLVIRGTQALNSPFIRLQLQVKCAGQGSISRSFVALPDLAPELPRTSANPEPSVEVPADSRWIDAPTASAAAPATPAAPRRFAPRPAVTPKPTQPAESHSIAAPARRTAPTENGSFHLRLSTGSIDTSRLGRISKEERAQLLAQQKQLDAADDRTSDVLALQQQVKDLQSELSEIRLKLKMTQPMTEAAEAPASQPAPAPVASQPAAAAAPQAAPTAKNPPAKTPPPPQPAPETSLTTYLAVGLSALLVALLGLRFYQQKIKQRWTGEDIWQHPKEDILEQPATVAAKPPQPVVVPVAPPAPAVIEAQPMREEPSIQAVHSPVVAEPPQQEMTQAEQDFSSETDSMIEEAELYAVHGHPDLAVKILTKLIEESPEKSQAWLLLLSIYSSLDRRDDFEQAARQFASIDRDGLYWKEVQALGHRIDEDNPLYFGQTSSASEVPRTTLQKTHRRPIGGILLDIGALSEEELMDALAQFHPKRDGRFGGFLLSLGQITQAQLDEALHIQHQEAMV